MSSYTFQAYGHKNIRAAHQTTLEFTKDSSLTPAGDCIVGVRATFEISKLKQFFSKEKIKITLRAGSVKEAIVAVPNLTYTSNQEMVIRTTGFQSARTFAVYATKSASGLSKELRALLCRPDTVITVTIT